MYEKPAAVLGINLLEVERNGLCPMRPFENYNVSDHDVYVGLYTQVAIQ